MSDLKDTAAKNDDLLAEMKARIMSTSEEDVEAQEIETVEQTTETESAPVEENTSEEETVETVESDNSVEEEDLTDEEKGRLSEKTRRQMSRLREQARKAAELEVELERVKAQKAARQPLEEVEVSESQLSSKYALPWQDKPLTRAEAKKIAREELESEQRLRLIREHADHLESTYEELNPNSEDYDPELTSYLYDSFKTAFRTDKKVTLKSFADRHMKWMQKARSKAEREMKAKQETVKQQSSQAITSSIAPPKKRASVRTKIKSAKTVDELRKLKASIK